MNSTILEKIKCDSIDCFKDDYFSESLANNIAHASYNNIAIEQNPYFIFLFDFYTIFVESSIDLFDQRSFLRRRSIRKIIFFCLCR